MTRRRPRGAIALVSLLVAALCLVWVPGRALGGPPSAPNIYIDAIVVDGLDRTELFVVQRELLVGEKQTTSLARIEESIQRIRNTGLFRKVEYELVASEEGATDAERPGDVEPVVLQITIDEKWTTLPIFNFSRGGGTYRLIVGAFDDNFLGRYIGIGGQFVRLGEANSFYGWIYHPRLFDQRLRGGIDLGTRNRIYTLFDEAGEVEGAFLLNRFTVGGHLQKEWLWWLRTQASLRWVNDDFSYDLLSPAIETLQRERGLPPSSHALIGASSLMLGRIDQDNYLFDGTMVTLSLEHANQAVGSSYTQTKGFAGLNHFETLPWKSNLAFRVAAGIGDIDAIHQRFYLGGLDAIRGFSSDRYAGEHYWLANLEFRIPSIDTRWFVLQHLFFVDAAGVSDDFSQVVGLSGASAGIGVRFIVPKIHGFIARVDYAFRLTGDAANPLSLGGGQFF